MAVKTRAWKIVSVSVPLAGLLALSACSGDSSSADDPSGTETSGAAAQSEETDDGVRVLQPGGPGDPTLEGDDVEVQENEHNAADVEFMTMMIPHHRQALVMSDLAKTRAEDPRVKRLAARIRAAQAPEIQYMSTWLTDQGEPVPAPEDDTVDGHADHGHGDMGMLDAEGLRALVDADGAEFDRLYLEGMIGHHEGAIEMAEDVEVDGSDIDVSILAADVNVGQVAEINRMQDILDSL